MGAAVAALVTMLLRSGDPDVAAAAAAAPAAAAEARCLAYAPARYGAKS